MVVEGAMVAELFAIDSQVREGQDDGSMKQEVKGALTMMSWQLDELARQAEGVLSDEHSRGRIGDSIGYGANDESTRSQREYSVDASGISDADAILSRGAG